MAKYAGKDFKLELKAGGSYRDITPYLKEFGGFKINSRLEDTTVLGAQWKRQEAAGLKEGDTITITGYFDDTATSGPDVVLYNAGAVLGTMIDCQITWGGTKVTKMELATGTGGVVVQSYERKPTIGEYTKFTATLEVSGQVQEA